MMIPLGLGTTAQEIPAMQGPGADPLAGAGMAAIGLVCLLLLFLLGVLIFVLVFLGKRKRRRTPAVATAPATATAYPAAVYPPVGAYPAQPQAAPYPQSPQTAPYPVVPQGVPYPVAPEAVPYPPAPQATINPPPAQAAPASEVNWREDTILRPVVAPRTGAEIVVTAGSCAGQRYTLAGSTRLGRAPDNEIVLSDPQASRFHAVINSDGVSYEIVDMGGANGTEVNGQRISAPTPLRSGDVIGIGGHTLTFVGPQ